MSILSRLKAETNDLHRAVEATPLNRSIMSDSFSLEDYKQLIVRNFYIHKSLEQEIRPCLDLFPKTLFIPFFQKKSKWLEKDLELLGLDLPANFSLEVPTPILDSPSKLVGCLYVIEGSMLGGKMIHNVFRKKESLSDISDFYFFNGNGKDQGSRWRAFQHLALSETSDPDEAIQAAKETFLFYKEVFEEIKI